MTHLVWLNMTIDKRSNVSCDIKYQKRAQYHQSLEGEGNIWLSQGSDGKGAPTDDTGHAKTEYHGQCLSTPHSRVVLNNISLAHLSHAPIDINS